MSTNYPTHTPRTVLITGSTGDFGKAFVKSFAGLGCRIILAGRDPQKLANLAAGLTVPVHTMCFDIGDRDAMKAAFAQIPVDFQDIDLLINNAGGALGLNPAHEADPDDWETMVDTNIRGLMHMTRLILPGMVARSRGHIIDIGSVAGDWPYPGGNVYCAVKAFTKQFSLALRADLHGKNVRVTNIEPGMVETQFAKVRFKGDEAKASAVYKDANPLHPEDVAQAVLWAATLPPHVNVNRLEIMPTTQSFGPLPVFRAPSP